MDRNEKKIWPGWETGPLIGRGSFGSVYEIQRSVFGDVEKAALKVISIPQNASDIEEMYSDGYDDESITSTFQSHLKSIVAEYSLMRKMNGSANIVNCDDIRYVQHDDGIGWDIFIKMELLTPLTKALPTSIPEETVIKIAKDMCAALELCKKHDIVHRDIKPQNIFMSPNGDYKLGDFGIAKTVEKTMGGTKIGTYKYMAPEVYNNQPYGTAADIYSLGLVLYWMLNERRMPFLPLPPAKLGAAMDESARTRRFSGEQIPHPAHGSEELKRIVLKACAYDPNERYASATEMFVALKALSGDRIVVIPPEPDPAPIPDPAPMPVPEPIPDSQQEPEPNHRPIPVIETSPKSSKAKNKLWPIFAAALACVVLVSIFFCSRVQVTGVPVLQKDLEQHLFNGCSAIGCYDVSALLKIGSTRVVEFPVGEAYNGYDVLVTDFSGSAPIAASVSDGKVSVQVPPVGTYLIQIRTEETEQLAWSEWSAELPEGVLLNSHQVEVDIMYRTSEKEYTESANNSLSGWELYDSHATTQPYGEWSEWSETILSATATLDVQSEHQYRYRTKETTSSTSSTLSGWTQYASEDNYSYGAWSEWSTSIISPNASTDVEERIYQWDYICDYYEDGVFVESGRNYPYREDRGKQVGDILREYQNSGYPKVTLIITNIRYWKEYRSRTIKKTAPTYYFYRWTNWSDWSSDSITSNSDREVQERDIYRSREIYGDTVYCFWRWGEWSDWSLTTPAVSDETKIETQVVYRYIQ